MSRVTGAATRRNVSPGISTLGGSTLPGASPRVVRELSSPRAQLGNVLGGRALGHRHTSQRLSSVSLGAALARLERQYAAGALPRVVARAGPPEPGRLSNLNRRRAAGTAYSSLALRQVTSRASRPAWPPQAAMFRAGGSSCRAAYLPLPNETACRLQELFS